MGFIEKRSGGYRARYRDPLGHLTSKTFTRKADAERWTKEMEVAMERGDWLDPRSAQVPLAVWAEEFLSLARRLSPSTQQTYRRDLKKYILPRFGAYRLGRLPADEIENWLNDEVAAGIAPSSVHRHYRVLRRMLQVAVQKRKLQSNPCDRVEPPRVPKTEMTFLTWGQAVALAESHQERYRALIYLAVDSGMRWSELIGLRRARVDLGLHKVRVTEQLIRLDGCTWHRKEPKTPASFRSITISSVVAELLAEHVDRFVVAGPDALLFANTVGSPLISSSFWQHHFSKGLRAAAVSCRFHDLRHTSVALAIAEGAHPKAIQTRMGHSSINVTLDRYGHLFRDRALDRRCTQATVAVSIRDGAEWGLDVAEVAVARVPSDGRTLWDRGTRTPAPESGGHVTTGERPVEAAEDGTGSTPRAVDEAIRRLGARPIASIDDLDRFRADLWDSDEELDSFLQWVRASRNGDD